MRDKFVQVVCTWLINHVATKEYRALCLLSNRFGMQEVDDLVTTWKMENENKTRKTD